MKKNNRFMPAGANLIRYVGFCCLFFLVAGGVLANTGSTARADGTMVQSAAEVDYPPFSFVDESGRATGFAVELLRAALAAMKREVSFRTGPWAEVRGWLERGDIDTLPLVGRTPEREALFDFTVPYMSLHGAIVVRGDETGVRDLSDLSGRQVAVMKGDNAEEFLRREARDFEIRTTPTFEVALHELADGRHDAVVTQRLVALRLIQKTGLTDLRVVDRPIEGFRQDFCFAVNEGDRDTLALLNEGLAIVVADGTYRYLHAKWFADMQLPADRPIIVGGDRNFPPFEFLDENGRPAGYNVDLTRAIAREMDLKVDIRLGHWPERVEALKTGKIDMLQGMFYSPARDLNFDFTQAHNVSQYVAVMRKDDGPVPESVDALEGKRIVVESVDILHEYALEKNVSERITLVDDQEIALRELADGRHDCALVSRITALYLIKKNGWANLVMGKKPLLTAEYCYASAKGQKALLAQFGEGLKALENSGEYRRIYDKWLGVYQDEPASFLTALRYSALVIIPLLVILLVSVVWSWALRRQVAAKTKELQESLDRFRYVFEAANVGKSMTLPTGEVNTNQAFADFLGYTHDELKGKRWQDLTPRADIDANEQAIAPLLTGEKSATRFEKRYVHKNGELLWGDVSVTLRRDVDGTPLYFMTTVVDIGTRKQAEEALRRSEEYHRLLAENTLDVIWIMNLQLEFTYVNPAITSLTGHSPSEWIGSRLPEHCDEEAFGRMAQVIADEMAKGPEGGGVIFETEMLKKTGESLPVEIHGKVIFGTAGQPVSLQGTTRDITERKRSQTRIEHLNRVLRAIRDVNQLIVREREMQNLIEEGCRLLVANRGYSSAMIVLTDDEERPYAWALEGQVAASGELAEMLEKGSLPCCCEHTRIKKDLLIVEDRQAVCVTCPLVETCSESQSFCAPLIHENKKFGYLVAVAEKEPAVDEEESSLFIEMAGDLAYALNFSRIEAAHESSKQRQKMLENQLIQAQKMESVGRLAGGVAHDYNNISSIIIGYSELALEKVEQGDPLHDDLVEIYTAAKRSTDITRQLLAFARQQTIAPKVLDLNDTIGNMLKMLQRLIGEDIDLAWLPGGELWPVKIDPSQVDQILANLCVNARDAIADVGKVTIETTKSSFDENYCAAHAGFVPGDYVMLAVSDDGSGIAQDEMDKIFEPFFTTKGIGRGTGLGLSTVYGIVKQNDGFINVYSEPEKGTTIRIYLPRHAGRAVEDHNEESLEIPLSKGEMVLLVEDDGSILKLGKRILENLGYAVLTATSPTKALELAKVHADEIDLLITDVVMPDMNGRELSEQLQTISPNLKTIFMSGYTANVIAHRGVLEDGVYFISKPFSKKDMAAKVREVLDEYRKLKKEH